MTSVYPTSERLSLAVIFAYEYFDCFEPVKKSPVTLKVGTAGLSILRPSEGDRVRNAGGRGGRLRRRQDHEHERPDTASPRRAGPARRLQIRIHAGLDLPSAHPQGS
jgi:hypothetical protein